MRKLRHQWVKPGVPNPRATDWYWSVTCEEPGCTAGGEQWAREQRFIWIYSRSPLLALLPELGLPSDQPWQSTNPTVNCACEGSRLRAPYENLMPDDLRWSWGGDASTGERLQIQIIISREVWLHRAHNKSTACRFISKPYQWASLVAQWLRICLPMQGTRVRALVWEDPTCRGATRPMSHNYWPCASGACALQQERPR